MAKLARPPEFIEAFLSPNPKMLEAIGMVAVAAAGVEDTLHHLYWRLSGMTLARGRIVTGDMRSHRMADDILKLAAKSKMDKKQIEDLKGIFPELRQLMTKRNQFLHSIWTVASPTTHKLKSPRYKTLEIEITCTPAEVLNLAFDLEWMEARLESHCATGSALLKRRKYLRENKDVYAPAPWL